MTATEPGTTGSSASPAGGPPDLAGITTLPALLLERGRTTPGGVALRKKELGRWKPYTWEQYLSRVTRVAAGLHSLGVRAGDRVAVLSGNRPAWVIADIAVQSLGAVLVGVYPTSPPSEVSYVLRHSGAVAVVVEDEEQFDKALAVWGELPGLRNVVVVDTRGVDLGARAGVMSLEQLESLGESGTTEWLARGVAALDPEKAAIIVYTSGTTGPPKGAMLSQANLLAAARAASVALELRSREEVLSYLPLAHIAERLVSVVNALAVGYTVNFGEGGESFLADMQEVQPTLFLGVPRVWEKLMASVEIRVRDASRLKRAAYRTGHRWGSAVARQRQAGRYGPGAKLRYLASWLLVARSVRRKLGLRRVTIALSGAAPIAPGVLEWFWALGVPVREAYGMTENTGLATVTPADDVRIGKVGRAYPGVEIRRADDGELCTRGAGTFIGYYADPDATKAMFDADGWLLTGDVGEIDADGYVSVTDRKKDIIITSGGKNISPSTIEGMLKVSPFIREAVVVGDNRRYLVALIGIESETVGAWAMHQDLLYTTYEDLSSRPEVRELIGQEVARANEHLAQVETIKRFALLPKELDQLDGEVTATQKVKRAAVADEFAKLIESLYEEPGGPT